MVRIHSPRPTIPLNSLVDTVAGAEGASAAFSSLCPKLCPPFCTSYAFHGGADRLGLRADIPFCGGKSLYPELEIPRAEQSSRFVDQSRSARLSSMAK